MIVRMTNWWLSSHFSRIFCIFSPLLSRAREKSGKSLFSCGKIPQILLACELQLNILIVFDRKIINRRRNPSKTWSAAFSCFHCVLLLLAVVCAGECFSISEKFIQFSSSSLAPAQNKNEKSNFYGCLNSLSIPIGRVILRSNLSIFDNRQLIIA